VNKMTQADTAIRRLPLVSREYATPLDETSFSLTGTGFGGFAGSDFVSTGVHAVVGTIGWRDLAPRVTHASMHTAKPAIRTNAGLSRSTNARLETSYQAPQAAMKQTRVIGLAKAAKDADRGVEGTARKRIPV
jgi:hypothetical protein